MKDKAPLKRSNEWNINLDTETIKEYNDLIEKDINEYKYTHNCIYKHVKENPISYKKTNW